MTRTFFNQKAAIWDDIASENDMTKLERMTQRLDIKPGSTILDVGTGTGVLIPFLLNQIGTRGHIVALDIAEKMLEKARGKGFNENIDYVCANVTTIPLDNEIFDSVVCYSTFPHFRDKPKALAEMKRVIKSGGKLLICHTSSRAAINEMHRKIPAVENDIIPEAAAMQRMLSRAGFTRIEIEDNNESYFCSATKSGLEQF